jgi:quinol monooxygenase YgiN
MTVHIVARFIARPECADALRTLLLGALEPTRKESGCIRYELLHNADDPTDFTFFEEWTDDAAFNAHLRTPHLKVVLDQSPSLLAVALDVRRYTVC